MGGHWGYRGTSPEGQAPTLTAGGSRAGPRGVGSRGPQASDSASNWSSRRRVSSRPPGGVAGRGSRPVSSCVAAVGAWSAVPPSEVASPGPAWRLSGLRRRRLGIRPLRLLPLPMARTQPGARSSGGAGEPGPDWGGSAAGGTGRGSREGGLLED